MSDEASDLTIIEYFHRRARELTNAIIRPRASHPDSFGFSRLKTRADPPIAPATKVGHSVRRPALAKTSGSIEYSYDFTGGQAIPAVSLLLMGGHCG
jgi:hypothetical protein